MDFLRRLFGGGDDRPGTDLGGSGRPDLGGGIDPVSDGIGPDEVERIKDDVLKDAVDDMVMLALETLKALN